VGEEGSREGKVMVGELPKKDVGGGKVRERPLFKPAQKKGNEKKK